MKTPWLDKLVLPRRRELPAGRLVEGEYRSQSTLLPECLDDYVTQDNPVRVVDVFVDNLDLASLGFDRAVGCRRQTKALR